MDWDAWARDFEDGGGDKFIALFAAGGLFCDPVTPWTTDVQRVAEQTHEHFPDWHASVDTMRTGDGWAVAQWTGFGTYHGDPTRPVTVTIHGVSVVDVDHNGKVVRWRDYLDTGEPLNQIQAGLR